MLLLGAHLSVKDGLAKMAQEAHHIDANAVQFFTRNPQGSAEKALDRNDLAAFAALCREYAIGCLVGYGPYDINPASGDAAKREFAVQVIKEDLETMGRIAESGAAPQIIYAFHPGHAMDLPRSAAVANVAECLNNALAATEAPHVKIALVQNGGEGSAMCSTFQEMAAVLNAVEQKGRVGMCFDTSAAWGEGYDIANNLPAIIQELDNNVGLDRVIQVHLTDSQDACGSKVNRHAPVGKGAIGFDALLSVLENRAFAGLPFILEEEHPTLENYRKDIELLRMHYGKAQR